MDYITNLPLKQKLLVGLFVVLIISIPTISFLVKQRTSFKSDASNDLPSKGPVTNISTSSGALNKNNDIKKQIEALTGKNTSSTSESDDTTSAYSFGPTLNFKVSLEGREANKQKAKVFVGLSQGGTVISNPQYLLSFNPETNDDGSFTGLSLAGLSISNTYTAYLKGPTQLATSSAFVVRPSEADLNDGLAVSMLTGDLNDDNKIDTTDYNLIKPFLGLTSNSSGWKEEYDFNQDQVINLIDLSFISKNLNKVGAGNVYTSHIESTQSGTLVPSNSGGIGGYWLWVPKIK